MKVLTVSHFDSLSCTFISFNIFKDFFFLFYYVEIKIIINKNILMLKVLNA